MPQEVEINILKSLVGNGEVVETHASTVLITPEYVYKIKKPVYFGFLDYRLPRQRKSCCIMEKELNCRYSDGIYTDVLKIVVRDKGYALVPLENTLPTLEYVVKMKRIPEENFLKSRLEHGIITPGLMESYGRLIAEKLDRAEKSPEIVEEMSSWELIKYNCEENFTQLREVAPDYFDRRMDYIEKKTLGFLSVNKSLFEKRYEEGFVRDGHGDLRLEHVYLDGNKLGLIDCIEFNRRFRTNDVVAEAAFLSMELDYSGYTALSDAFLKGFFDKYSGADSLALLNFYRCYRAVVRAKVAILTLLGQDNNSDLYKEKMKEFDRLVDMACMYAYTAKDIKPLVFCGLIATGKSVNAKYFVSRFPAIRLNSDEIRKAYFGLNSTANAVAPVDEGLYTPENTAKIYRELGRLSREAIALGRLPVVDGTFLKKRYKEAFEQELQIQPIYIEFAVPDDEIIRRLEVREKRSLTSDGRLHHFFAMKEKRDSLPRDLMLSGQQKARTNSENILDYLFDV